MAQTTCINCGGSYDGTPSGLGRHQSSQKHMRAVAPASGFTSQKVEGVVVPKDATAANRPDLFGTRGQVNPDGDGGVTSRMAFDKPEYATPDVSGIESGFYVGDRGLPWHVTLSRQLGTPDLMQDAGQLLTADEAIALMGADWEVELLPVQVAGGKVIPERFAVVRTDTRDPLGIVGRTYKTVQNRDAFAFADNLVDSGEAKYETGGLMRGGRWVFLSMELDHLGLVVPGDPSEFKTYLLVTTSHDGSKPTEAHITHVRTVCRNTWRLAVGGAVSSFRIRHSGTIEGKLAEARKALGIAFRNTETVQEVATRLAGKSLVDRQVQELFEKVWPISDEATEAVRERAHATLAFENYLGSPTVDAIRGTAWGALQGLTEYVDHEIAYKSKTRGDNLDARADSLIYGAGEGAKVRATKELLKLAK